MTSFEQGWFSSKARSKLVLDGELAKIYAETMAETGMPAQDFEISFTHDIRHGPLMVTDDGLKLALAYANTKLVLPPLYELMMASYLKGEPLFTFNTTFGFTGGTATEIINPSYDDVLEDGTRIRWDGIGGVLLFDGTDIDFELGAPLLEVDAPGMATKAVIRGIDYTGDMTRYGEHLFIGTSRLLFPEISISGMTGDIKFVNAEYATESAIDDQDNVMMAGWFALESGQAPMTKMGVNRLEFKLEGIPAPALDQLYDGYYSLFADFNNPAALEAKVNDLMANTVPALFDGPAKMSVILDADIDAQAGVFVGQSELTISGKDQLITVALDQAVERANIEEYSLTDSVARASLSGIDGKVISDVYGQIIAISMMGLPEWQQSQEMELLFASQMPAIIGPQTRLTLENLAVNMPQGNATATGTIGFTGDGPINLEDGPGLTARLDGTLNGRIDESALLWFVAGNTLEDLKARFAEAGQPLSDEEAQELATNAASGQIAALEAQSMIKRDGNAFTVDAELKDGELTLNGINRPDLMGQ